MNAGIPTEANSKRPILLILTSHWVAMLGVALVTLAGLSWLTVLPASAQGHIDNPYIGLLAFIAIPAVFFAGLALIPIGIYLGKRKVRAGMTGMPDNRQAWKRAGLFFIIMSAVNLVIGTQGTYRAVEHMETAQFCGQSCHVMKPEFTGHLSAPHERVACASCHIAPGAAGWVKAKAAGTQQLIAVMFNSFPRPIESAMENNKLVSANETCESCHDRTRVIGPRLRVIPKFKDDEANTRTETVLTMMVGGGRSGGIHSAHLGPGVQIRYVASDKKRQTIPWVEYKNSETNLTRTYVAGADVKTEGMTIFEMQCVDCHNRAAHAFRTAESALDQAMARGEIPANLPFVKKTAMELVSASYATDEEATQKIRAGITSHYASLASQRTADIQKAADGVLAVYQRNVFPDLKVTWGTYPSNLGHTDSPGCFRCHDDSHSTADKKTITNDCGACHQAVAVDEASPEVLKTLGIASNGNK